MRLPRSPSQEAIQRASEDELESWLATPSSRKPQPLVGLPSSLPELRFASGRLLSKDAQTGWLVELAKETPEDPPNMRARWLRERLDRESLEAFGRALNSHWMSSSRYSADRWLRQQMSICATSDWLHQMGVWLRESDVALFARHGSKVGLLSLFARDAKATSWDLNAALARIRQEHPPSELPTEEQLAHFLEEREDDQIPNHHFNEDGSRFADLLGFQFRYELFHTRRPQVDQLCPRLEVHLLEQKALDAEAHPGHALRKAILLQQQLSLKVEQSCLRVEERFEPGRCWTRAGWSQLFLGHALWRYAGLGLLFRDLQGQLFSYSTEGDLHDEVGGEVLLKDDCWVAHVPLDSLPDDQAEAWRSCLKAKLHRLPLQPEHNLGEDIEEALSFQALRELLYLPPSAEAWASLCDLLETWPDAESLPVALEYVQSHAEPWGDLARTAPQRWIVYLLREDHPWRRKYRNKGLQIEGHDFAPLSACNHIDLNTAHIALEDARNIAASPHLDGMVRLSLCDAQLLKDAMLHLAQEARFPALRSIDLSGLKCKAEDWTPLFDAPWMSQVLHLILRSLNSRVDGEHLPDLLYTQAFEGLEILDLRFNPNLGEEGLEVLLASPAVQSLKHLLLDSRDLGFEGIQILASSGSLTGLEILTLMGPMYNEHEGQDDIETLAHSTQFPKLRELRIHRYTEEHVSRRWIEILSRSKTLPQAAIESLERYG